MFPAFILTLHGSGCGIYNRTMLDESIDVVMDGFYYLGNSKERLLSDLPTNTKDEWINKQNEKLNKISMCRKNNG